jgi:hypothetical protein
MKPFVLLHQIYILPSSIQSNLSRNHSQQIACLASCGLITTREKAGVFGRVWRVSAQGLTTLKEQGFL